MPTRRPQEPFVWRSASRPYATRAWLIVALCVVCGSAGYMAGRSAVHPDPRAAAAVVPESPTIARKTTEALSPADREAETTHQTTSPSSQITASATDKPRVVILNPNVSNEESEERPALSGKTSVKPAARESGRKQKIAVPRRASSSVGRHDLSGVRSPSRPAPHNAWAPRRDNTFRNYQDLRESMLR
jgi:hypothetical protein